MRIGLMGYYNYGNYGDELFKTQMQEAIANASFEVLDQAKLMSDGSYREWFQQKIDFTIIGGGDLIIPYGWAEWYFQSILHTKPIVVFSVGVPTWGGHDANAVEKMRAFFRHPSVRAFITRDSRSTLWVQKHLEVSVPVQTFADMVCALNLPEIDRSAAKIFTIITREQRPGEIEWQNLAALVERARRYGYFVRNLILGTGITADQDKSILAVEGSYFDWEVVTGSDNESLTRLIGDSTVVASMKFHGCVVATMYGLPAIGLSTTDKFTSLFEAIGRPDLMAHHSHTDLADRLPKYLVPIPRCTIESLRKSARNGLSALKQVVESISVEL